MPRRRPCHAGVNRRVWRSMRPSSTCMKRTVQSPRSVSASPTEFAADRLAHKHQLAPPLDLPVRPDAPHLVRRVIPRVLEPRGVGPGRGRIDARRRRLAERFVRPLRIELAPHAIEPPLAAPRRRRRRRRRLLLQRQMKALVPAILLRMPGVDPIELDPQLQPPHRQAARAGPAPVVANGDPLSVRSARGKPYVRNVRSNHGRTPALVGADDPTTQHEPTARVGHRQRIAPRPIRRPKPAFEVRRPDIIRRVAPPPTAASAARHTARRRRG